MLVRLNYSSSNNNSSSSGSSSNVNGSNNRDNSSNRRKVSHAGRQKQEGAALLMAMMITAAMTVLATSLMLSQQISIRRTANILYGSQAYQFSLAAERLGILLLDRDRQEGQTDHMGENWALASLTGIDIPIPGYEHLKPEEQPTVNVRIQDLNSRFNLNNLVDAQGQVSRHDLEMFQRLLRLIGLSEQENIALAIVDWVDTNIDPSFPDGAEDNEYLGLEVPYRTANRYFTSPTELYLVKGMSKELYDALFPYITAVPGRTKINLNTAPAELIAIMHNDLTLSQAKEIVKQREEEFAENGFTNINEFVNLEPIAQLIREDNSLRASLNDYYGVSSHYFLISSAANYGEGRMQLYSVISRNSANSRTIYRGQGSF